MPLIGTPILQHHVGIPEHLRARRTAQRAQPISFVPLARLGDSSDTQTRPRHHFRRGAISEASGQPSIPLVDGGQENSQSNVRIRSRTANEFEISIRVPLGRHLQRAVSTLYRPPLNQERELADRIRRGLLNVYTPRRSRRINAVNSTLTHQTTAIQSHPPMERSSETRRDTLRYGRDGWWTVEHEPDTATRQRPATLPGSDFAVPDSTLNLFQSVDLFAPPPRRPTIHDRALDVTMRVELWRDTIQTIFNEAVAARRRGEHIDPGTIFECSMELSRLLQLRRILEDELGDMETAEIEAARRLTRDNQGRSRNDFPAEEDSANTEDHCFSDAEINDPEGWPTLDSVIQGDYLGDMVEEGVASITDIPEPEGWANLGFVSGGGDYLQEVCFRIGSRELIYPIEEVEDWIMNERRRERSARAAQRSPFYRPDRRTEREHGPQQTDPDNRRILHTLEMPQTTRSRWRHAPPRARTPTSVIYQEDDGETDYEGYYVHVERDELQDHYPESDPLDTDDEEEYEIEEGEAEEDEAEVDGADGTTTEVDHESSAGSAPQESQVAEQLHAMSGQEADSLPARRPVLIIDLTGSSSPSASSRISQNTGDESNSVTARSWEIVSEQDPAAPHPVAGWASEHSCFMFSCRGSIFDVTRQLQNAFGFQPELSPHQVGGHLNDTHAAEHYRFVQRFLPGELGTRMRARNREISILAGTPYPDVYHGTQEIPDSDSTSRDYALPPDLRYAPESWDRRMDVWMLRDLNRGRFNLVSFWHRWRETLGGSRDHDDNLRAFLSVRLAQVRYLGITEAELANVYWEEMGSRGEDW